MQASLTPAAKCKVSNCPLNGEVGDLLLPLFFSKSLSTIRASRSNLTGNLPNLARLQVSYRAGSYTTYRSPLADVLQNLDLSANCIRTVKGLNIKSWLSLSGNTCVVDIPHGLLRQAVHEGIRLELTDVALTDAREATELLADGLVNRTDGLTITDAAGGFACYGLRSPELQVTPAHFLPGLLCGCQQGWQGTGTACKRCSKDQYNENFNQTKCTQCPTGSGTKDFGSVSQQVCQCVVGRTALSKREAVRSSFECGTPARRGQATDEEPVATRCKTCDKIHSACASARVQDPQRLLPVRSDEGSACQRVHGLQRPEAGPHQGFSEMPFVWWILHTHRCCSGSFLANTVRGLLLGCHCPALASSKGCARLTVCACLESRLNPFSSATAR